MSKDTERLARLKNIVATLPETPGSYQYLNAAGTIIYVGKAKNLKRRVSSYFLRTAQTDKTAHLVAQIHDIHYIVVPTDEDALLLENQLIKRYKPHYNILLKDDKTYPYVCITNEPYPRLYKTRRRDNPHATYYGPYAHAATLNNILHLIERLYHIRTCRTNITPDTIARHQHLPCLAYHIHRCLAPCCGTQTQAQYLDEINQIRQILSGHTNTLIDTLTTQMTQAADAMRYEQAAEIKHRIDLVHEYIAHTRVTTDIQHDIDVLTIDNTDPTTAYINYLHLTDGIINLADTIQYKKKTDDSTEEILALGIIEMRTRHQSAATEIILPIPLDIQLRGTHITVPQRGERRHLLDLSLANVRQYKFDTARRAERLTPEQRTTNLLRALRDTLGLDKMPHSIECFDNSNISGTDPVAGLVVFRDARPARREYRKYHIRTVSGPDDYASMAEVVERRYRRLTDEHQPLPDLIITDGGTGQIDTVHHVVHDILHLDIPIAGLAKDYRHRTSELLTGYPPRTVGIDIKSPLFQLLTRIQDEVHRYAITFHRDTRSRRQTRSQLDTIPGIGPATKTLLLRHFHSVARIRQATQAELTTLIGAARTRKLLDGLGTTPHTENPHSTDNSGPSTTIISTDNSTDNTDQNTINE